MIAWFRHSPLGRRITGYSAGSVIAAGVSELAFAVTLYFAHTGTAAASAAGFVGGAVPNYFLNRRWAWKEDRRGRSRRAEIGLYVAVALVTFLVSTVVTGWALRGARHVTHVHLWRVLLTAAAYLGVSAVFFVIKFVLYERVVFKEGRATTRSDGTRLAPPTRSSR